MSFRISGLDPAPFAPLFGLSDAQLAEAGARRVLVDAMPGVPDRIELRDLEPGETAILLNHVHQPADTPYRASHAIFVREGAAVAWSTKDEVPEVLRRRMISLRAFDAKGDIVGAELVDGRELEGAIDRQLAQPDADYLHAHYAAYGCYAARIDRA